MLRRHYALSIMLAVIASLIFVPRALNSIRGSDKSSSQEKTGIGVTGAHTISLAPWGPTQEMFDNARVTLLRNPAILKRLGNSRSRLISFKLIDGGKTNGSIMPPEGYRAILFDYTHNVSYSAIGRFESSTVQIAPNSVQPLPSDDEFDAAVVIVSRDPKFGPGIANGTLSVYRPMPPLIDETLPVGRSNRTLAVGLESTDGSESQILGVDMITESISSYPNNAPAGAIATPTSCGVSSQGGGSNTGTVPYHLVIMRAGVEIWSLDVVTPTNSSGNPNRGSGVEVLNVNYRGQRVLGRGNIPILNVQYEAPTGCGPYRDWLDSQSNFTANGSDLASGIRLCTSAPQTILESGTDAGNFSGVAIWDNRENVQLVSEMSAGWYRYLMEWNFSDDGIIRPRFGFGSTSHSCVCHTRNHHAYWRFDFDIGTSSNNTVTEHSPAGTVALDKETMRGRVYGQDQTWTVTNSSSSLSATIVPGINDSNYDKYGTGDVWVLVNRSTEIDDGAGCVSGCSTSINIGPYMTPAEATTNTDIVVWYGAHCNRFDASNPLNLIGDHVLGPDIVLKNY